MDYLIIPPLVEGFRPRLVAEADYPAAVNAALALVRHDAFNSHVVVGSDAVRTSAVGAITMLLVARDINTIKSLAEHYYARSESPGAFSVHDEDHATFWRCRLSAIAMHELRKAGKVVEEPRVWPHSQP